MKDAAVFSTSTILRTASTDEADQTKLLNIEGACCSLNIYQQGLEMRRIASKTLTYFGPIMISSLF